MFEKTPELFYGVVLAFVETGGTDWKECLRLTALVTWNGRDREKTLTTQEGIGVLLKIFRLISEKENKTGHCLDVLGDNKLFNALWAQLIVLMSVFD